jgi:hypothetical protein
MALFNLLRLLANEEVFTDELYAFVIDANANHRNERGIVTILNELAPQIVDVAECMIIDGVKERGDVADYVHAIVSGEGLDS